MKHTKSDLVRNKEGNLIPKCSCGSLGVYNKDYDAFFCPKSFVWMDPKCYSVGCKYCSTRPELAPSIKEVVNEAR